VQELADAERRKEEAFIVGRHRVTGILKKKGKINTAWQSAERRPVPLRTRDRLRQRPPSQGPYPSSSSFHILEEEHACDKSAEESAYRPQMSRLCRTRAYWIGALFMAVFIAHMYLSGGRAIEKGER